MEYLLFDETLVLYLCQGVCNILMQVVEEYFLVVTVCLFCLSMCNYKT